MDNEYADLNDIPGNIVIQPYMFEPPQRPNNQESSEESDNGDEDARSFLRASHVPIQETVIKKGLAFRKMACSTQMITLGLLNHSFTGFS